MTLLRTMAPCVEPTVASHILDDVRRGGSLSSAEIAHVSACDSCRDAVERARRMAEVWAKAEPSGADVQRARARFFSRRAGRRKAKIAPVSLALAVLLVAAAASAAVRVGMKYLHSAPRDAVALASSQRPPGPATATDPTATRPVSAEPAPAEQPSVATTTPPDTTIATRTRVSDARPRRAPPAPEPRSTAVEATPPPNSAETAQAWAAAADAMRAADYPRAEAAFAELTRSTDAHTRDAARLARAQVWVAQGRLADARPELEDLAANGATAALQGRAAAAIERLR
jgi:hypothetical protein